ncbi:MAG: hypothetical protein JWN70_341, partial [Planctomycetaceae bacterium]|nr:hypothetical protein [Planctomycetaceae bacterium]
FGGHHYAARTLGEFCYGRGPQWETGRSAYPTDEDLRAMKSKRSKGSKKSKKSKKLVTGAKSERRNHCAGEPGGVSPRILRSHRYFSIRKRIPGLTPPGSATHLVVYTHLARLAAGAGPCGEGAFVGERNGASHRCFLSISMKNRWLVPFRSQTKAEPAASAVPLTREFEEVKEVKEVA